jgi:hypothetical protein
VATTAALRTAEDEVAGVTRCAGRLGRERGTGWREDEARGAALATRSTLHGHGERQLWHTRTSHSCKWAAHPEPAHGQQATRSLTASTSMSIRKLTPAGKTTAASNRTTWEATVSTRELFFRVGTANQHLGRSGEPAIASRPRQRPDPSARKNPPPVPCRCL